MAPNPTPRTLPSYQTTPSRTPQSKHRIHHHTPKNSGNSLSITPTVHPVEVVGRIRDYADHKDKTSSSTAPLEVAGDGRSLRVRTDSGYRDFSLDGVSFSENENLESFYQRFVESRVEGVRSGAKCTIMMYGPTGSGKSHTMFGCGRQPGIVYRALRDILGEGDRDAGFDDAGFGLTLFVQVTVLEIYNEEIYDLLSGGSTNCAAGAVVALPKGGTPKARLEVMGKKAKNATYITGNEAGKISREVAKVEKRRIVKSTLCNDRSSRSHCLIMLDVPSVGGRLMLVDMAGSENIEQAGQAGFEAKMQTAKINQGNTALKRVVESIANGDSHVPFRDSKLTMLLQDSFEDDKSKILMILCASPDPKERHKTIATLEYGAKAKCIIRVAHMPTPRDNLNIEDSSLVLRSRIAAMNQFIYKLQMENKMKEKECIIAQRELILKEEELIQLRSKLQLIEGSGTAAREEDVKCLVDERTQALIIEMTKMEERMHQQQEELDILRQQLEEMKSSKCASKEDVLNDIMCGEKFLKRLSEMCTGDQAMEKSMELDMGDQHPIHDDVKEHPIHDDVKEIKEDIHYSENHFGNSKQNSYHSSITENVDFGIPRFPDKVCLSTVFEMEDEGEDREGMEEGMGHRRINDFENFACLSERQSEDLDSLPGVDNVKDPASDRRTRIQNIFRLCGNHREVAQQVKIPSTPKKRPEYADMHSSPLALRKELAAKGNHSVEFALPKLSDNSMRASESVVSSLIPSVCIIDSKQELKENKEPRGAEAAGMMDVYVKWETSKGFSANLIKKLKVLRNSTLSDLRKIIEAHLVEETNNNQSFIFLLLSDPMGTSVLKEKEAAISVNKLPIWSNQPNSYLACLRPTKNIAQWQNHIPFSSLENTLALN